MTVKGEPQERASHSMAGSGEGTDATVGRKRLNIGTMLRTAGPSIGGTVVFVGLWQGIVTGFGIPAYLVPAPSAVAVAMGKFWPELSSQSVVTIEEVVLGFAISIVVGVPAAVLIAGSRFLERVLYPLLVASQAVPKIALAPLFIVWVGLGITPKSLMAFLISFFPVLIGTLQGLRSVPPEMVNLGRSMGTGPIASFTKLRLPHALPSVFSGLKVGITLAVVGAVAAEFVGSDSGLGYLLVKAGGVLETPLLFASLIVVSFIGIVLFALVGLAERLILPWHVSQRRET